METYIRNIPLVGRFYEQLIGIVKNSLKKILGRARLTYDEIHTFIWEIENIVNTRPLTYLGEKNFDEPLTPYTVFFIRITKIRPKRYDS